MTTAATTPSVKRAALNNSITALIGDPDIPESYLAAAVKALLGDTVPPARPVVNLENEASPSKPRGKRTGGKTAVYIRGLLPDLRAFMEAQPIDLKAGMPVSAIREGMLEQGKIKWTVSEENIHRVLSANTQVFTKLTNGNWLPRPRHPRSPVAKVTDHC